MNHSEETKTKAVADYLNGDPWRVIMKRYRIGKTTLHRWTSDMHGDRGVEIARRQRRLDNPKKSTAWRPPLSAIGKSGT
jgi:hypothetical protein